MEPIAWEAFVEGETAIHTREDAEAPFGRLLAVPLGSYGVLVAADDGEQSFECRLTGTTVFDPIVDQGGAPQRVTADGEELRIVVELPRSADVRGVVERIREAYPDAELAARRERSRPVQTATTFRASLDEQLTDRQREVLTATYLAGFFESPRASTGQEVAASLGISQPTFNTHLRTAERRLFTMLFDER